MRYPPGRSAVNVLANIDAGLRAADYGLFLLCENACRSEFVQTEVSVMLLNDPSNRAGRVITLKTSDCRPEGILATLSWLDCRGDALDTELPKCLEELNRRRSVANSLSFMAPDVHISKFLISVALQENQRLRTPWNTFDCRVRCGTGVIWMADTDQQHLRARLNPAASMQAIETGIEILGAAATADADDTCARPDVLQLAPHVVAIGTHALSYNLRLSPLRNLVKLLLSEFKLIRGAMPAEQASLRRFANHLRSR